jgi:protein-S-isoprenylcysteine O-methyltransferase Ste14
VVSGIKNSLKPIMIIQLFVFIIVVPFLPLLISCRWNWWEAWLYAAVSITGFIVSRFMAEKRNPGLLKERARFTDHDNVKPWDRVLSPLVSLGGSLILLIAGLDELFNWSGSVPLVVKIAALAVILAGYGVGTWALIENRFFSAVVRIQGDRKHSVI